MNTHIYLSEVDIETVLTPWQKTPAWGLCGRASPASQKPMALQDEQWSFTSAERHVTRGKWDNGNCTNSSFRPVTYMASTFSFSVFLCFRSTLTLVCVHINVDGVNITVL